MENETIRELVEEILKYSPREAASSQTGRLLPKIVLGGTESVGKSSLFNMLLGSKRAIVSDVPLEPDLRIEGVWANALLFVDGITYRGNFSDFGNTLSSLDCFIQICDIQAIRRLDVQLSMTLKQRGIPQIIVLNKADMILSEEKRTVIRTKAETSFTSPVILVSAHTGENIAELIYSIGQVLRRPQRIEFIETLVKQGKVLMRKDTDKQKRDKGNKIVQAFIRKTTAKAASGKIADLTEIVFLHSEMIKKIAEVYGVPDPPETIESKSTHIIQSAIQTLSQTIPLVGDRISVFSMILWTSSIGNTAIEYFENQIDEKHLRSTLDYYSRGVQPERRYP